MAGQYSPQEIQYFDRLFNLVDQEKVGILTGDLSIAFLIKSKLPQRTLGEIWALSDPNNTGYLAKDGWYKCCRLIGWCQGGETVKEELLVKTGPIPRFDGVPPPPPTPVPQSALTPQTTGTRSFSPAPPSGGLNPPLTQADRSQFTRVFAGSGPEGGLITGQKAQGIFMKSGLGVDKLAAIWNLADTQQRGSLDLPDFIIGMYYIQGSMSGTVTTLPASLPAGLYEAASGGRGRPPPPPPPAVNAMARQVTGPISTPGLQGSPSAIPRQVTGQPGYQGGMLQPQSTGQSFSSQQAPQRQFSSPPSSSNMSAFPGSFGGSTPQPPQPQQVPWDITPQDKKTSDGFFDGMDTARRGFLEGDAVVPFMMQSGLDSGILAQVWDLADIRKEGKLSKEEFAVAMHLINGKLGGRDLPSTLPIGMTPPNLRRAGQQGATPEPAKDLFDIFGETPPAETKPQQQQQSYFAPAQAASRAISPPVQSSQQLATDPFGMPSFAVQSSSGMADLMGDDDDDDGGPEEAVSNPAPPPAPAAKAKAPPRDRSIDIASAQASVESTSKAIIALEGEREILEEKESAGSAQLREVEMRLSSVKAQFDNETRAVNDLKSRVADQKSKRDQNRKDLIKNESELSALRAEKDEIEQTLLRDKEEVRSMGKRMKEVTEETSKLKAVLEAMKKDARQQKGMVAIGKKQVTSLESGKDALQSEMDNFAASQQAESDSFSSPVDPRSDSPFAPATRTLVTAQSIPLPVTPQRALSPNPTGSKSNNPFERMGFGAKSPLAAPAPVEEEDQGILSNISGVQTATLGIGAVITAGALAVGGIAAGAVTGVTTAVTTGLEAVVGEHGSESQSANVKDSSAPGSPIASDTDTGAHRPDVPAAEELDTLPATVTQTDPFGLAESSGQDDIAPAAVETTNDDPFGMPSFTREAEAGSNFDSTFGDDFGTTPFTGGQDKPKDLTESLHLAPSSEATPGFDSEFDDFDEAPAVPAVASAVSGMLLKPHLPERSLSTQALPAESAVHTPVSEGPGTPIASWNQEEEERPVPVDVATLAPKEDLSRMREHQDDESSDDDLDTPEEADGVRSPFGGESEPSANQSLSNSRIGAPDFETAPTSPITSNYGRDSPAPVTTTRAAPPFELFPSGVASPPTNATSPFGALSPSISETRRAPPPPPTQARSASTSNNPFASFASAPSSTPSIAPPAPEETSIPIAPPIARTTPRAATGKAPNFDDDDFDFDDLPAAQVASSTAKPANGASTTTRSDFDDEFDDFSTDFEMVSKPSSTNNSGQRSGGGQFPTHGSGGTPVSLGGALPPPPKSVLPEGRVFVQDAPQIQGFDEMFGGGDLGGSSVFGSSSRPGQGGSGQQPQQPQQSQGFQSQTSTFSFDDAFGDINNSAPPTHANDSRGYAAPSGPPPSSSGGRAPAPPLPNRQPSSSGIATAAQPDDLNDVKKLCNMGFDRELVIAALEANDYSFDKTLNALLPGA